jgi:hypothetical protein
LPAPQSRRLLSIINQLGSRIEVKIRVRRAELV